MKERIYSLIIVAGILIGVILGSTKIASAEEQEMEVIYEQNSSYSVQIPKSLYLDSNGEATYSVGVKGSINENSYIEVIPDSTFMMKDSSGTKEDIQAIVTPSKTQWFSNELSQEYNVSNGNMINMERVDVGSWKGTVVYHISLIDTENPNPGDHVHDYTVAITKEPTCTEDGEKTYTCECGDSYTEVIPKLGHNYVDGTCTNCGEKDPDYLIETDPSAFFWGKNTSNGVTTWYITGLTSSGSKLTDFVIPKFYQGGEVTGIGTYNGNGIFGTTTKSVILPNTIKYIGQNVFQYSKIESIMIPDSVTNIMNNAFFECGQLKHVKMSKNIATIGDSAFFGCYSVEQFDLPDTLTTIGNKAFSARIGLQITAQINIPSRIESIGSSAFFMCIGITGEVILPDTLTSLGDSAFAGCSNIESVDIRSNISEIKSQTFSGCVNLSTVKLPNSIGVIQAYVFNGCSKLSEINMPDTLKAIGEKAFSECTSLKDLSIPSSVTLINANAFYKVPHISYNGTASGTPWGAISKN